MIEHLDSGIKIAEIIIKPIEKIFKNILNIKDKNRKKAELKRLMELLNATRISRTINSSFVYYLKSSIINYQSKGKSSPVPKNEIEVAVEQLENGIKSLMTIVNEMVDKTDKVLIHQNKAWTDLSIIVNERSNLLNEFKNIDLNKKNIELIESFANRYEDMTDRLGSISFKISKYARELDEN